MRRSARGHPIRRGSSPHKSISGGRERTAGKLYTTSVTTSPPVRIAVVGGGISGLAAAHRLIERASQGPVPLQVSLYEASSRLGGVFGTEECDGYRLELGADMFITDKPWGLDLCRRLGLEDQLIVPDPRYRQSLILSRGRPVPTPEAFQLLVPGRWGPIVTTPLLSPWGKLRLLLEPFVPPRRPTVPDEDESIAAFVRRRLGREALERIVQPLVGGIYTGDPEKLSLMATLPGFLQMERESGSLTAGLRRQRLTAARCSPGEEASGARYGLFVSLRAGLGRLVEALHSRLAESVRWQLNQPVLRVDRRAGADRVRYRVVTAEHSAEYDGLILALPSYRAAVLVESAHPSLAAALREIEYASTVVVVTGHRLDEIEHPLDAYGLVIPQREQRRILAVSFLSRKFPDRAPPGRVVLRTFVGGALQPELTRLSDDETVALVREELRELLGVRGAPEVCRVARHDRAMPQYHVGHLDRVRRLEALQRQQPGLELCGNAYHGVGLPDCIHDGEAATERLLATLTLSAVAPPSPPSRPPADSSASAG